MLAFIDSLYQAMYLLLVLTCMLSVSMSLGLLCCVCVLVGDVSVFADCGRHLPTVRAEFALV